MSDSYCWYWGMSDGATHPVGQKLPNAWGLYDMSGNVDEWCQDVYPSDYEDCPANGSAYTGSGSCRVRRGGCWSVVARFCRSADRGGCSSSFSYNDLGLRLARSAR
jgi:formylglycine-generating enzyme required for sulfatase activity